MIFLILLWNIDGFQSTVDSGILGTVPVQNVMLSPQDRTPVQTESALDIKPGARTPNNAISCLGSPTPRRKVPAGM
jgi:hypothetical protein